MTKAWPDLVEPNPCSTAAKTFFHAAVDSGVISSKQCSDLWGWGAEGYILWQLGKAFACVCFVSWCCFFKEIDQLASQSSTMAGYRKNTADLFVFLGGAQERRLRDCHAAGHDATTILCFPNHESLPLKQPVYLAKSHEAPWPMGDQSRVLVVAW